MIGTTKEAKRLLPFFEAIAEMAGKDTGRVRLSISQRHPAPESQFDTIRLPDLSDEPILYVTSFLHELQHVRDILDGDGSLTREQMEARAVRAERAVLVHARGLVARFAYLFDGSGS